MTIQDFHAIVNEDRTPVEMLYEIKERLEPERSDNDGCNEGCKGCTG